MTKKKQSKRSAKQAARKGKASGVDPTLHEIPAALPPFLSTEAHELSAPEPIGAQWEGPDPAALPSAHDSIAAEIEAEQNDEDSDSDSDSDADSDSESSSESMPSITEVVTKLEPSHTAPQAETTAPFSPSIGISHEDIPTANFTAESALQTDPLPTTPETVQLAVSSGAATVPENIWAPNVTAPAASQSAESQAAKQTALPQITTYDISALDDAEPAESVGADNAAINPVSPNPLGKAQSLGRLTRSKSSSEVSKGLPSKDESYRWRAPVDYFGASAAAFSSSVGGTSSQDANALKNPLAEISEMLNASVSGQNSGTQIPATSNQAPHTTPAPAPITGQNPLPAAPVQTNQPVYPQPSTLQPPTRATSEPVAPPNNGTNTPPGLSPKMAKFISSLRERGLAPEDTPTSIQLESTSIDITPTPSASSTAPTSSAPTPAQMQSTSVDLPTTPAVPPASTPTQMQSTSVDVPPIGSVPQPVITPVSSNKAAQSPKPEIKSAQTARDLAAFAKGSEPKNDTPLPEPKAVDEVSLLAPQSSASVAELRESIISQREGAPEDWHPVTKKKKPRTPDPAADESDAHSHPDLPKIKSTDGERHLSLEEMAALDPDLLLPPSTTQQQSVRRLKSKTTAGVRFEIYLIVYLVCIGLSWLTEQSAFSGTCRDAGQRVQSAVQVITPKPLADNFIAGENFYDDRDIKLHPFNPKHPPNAIQFFFHKTAEFWAGISNVFGKIPAAFAAANENPIAQTMILLVYSSILIVSLLIYFRFKRSMQYGLADLMLLPICLLAASSAIGAVVAAVLSMSESLAVGYIPNTIVVFTALTFVLAALDMARRSFLGRKQTLVRD